LKNLIFYKMTDETLIDYIKSTRELGYNDHQIKIKLLDTGWNEKEVDEALGINQEPPKASEIPPLNKQKVEANDEHIIKIDRDPGIRIGEKISETKVSNDALKPKNILDKQKLLDQKNEDALHKDAPEKPAENPFDDVPPPLIEASEEDKPKLGSSDLFTQPDIPGQEKPQEQVEEPLEKKKMSILAIVALVLAVFLPPIGFILGIIALILVIVKKRRGMGFAIAAIIVSIIMTSVIILVLPMLFMKNMFTDVNTQLESINTLAVGQALCTSQVDVDVIKVAGTDRACISSDKFVAQVENKGQIDIKKWGMHYTQNLGDHEMESTDALPALDVGIIKFDLFGINRDEIEIIEIETFIELEDGSEASCDSMNLRYLKEEISSIEDCDSVEWDDN